MNNTLDETRQIKLLISQVSILRDTIQKILTNSDMVEHSRYVSYKSFAEEYNTLVESAKKLIKVPTSIYTFKTEKMKGHMDTPWGNQKQIVE